MRLINIVIITIGILCGVAITLLLRRLRSLESEVVVENNAADMTSTLRTVILGNEIRDETKKNTGLDKEIVKLNNEKSALMNRLAVVDSEIARLRGSQDMVKSTTTPVKANSSSVSRISSSIYASQAALVNQNHNTITDPAILQHNGESCKYRFKVYVYPIPQTIRSLSISEEARRNRSLHVCQKCILEQFALEYIIYDFFTQFCGRTMNAAEADYFYLPLVRDAEFRQALELGGNRNRAPSATEQALLNIIEKNDSKMWKEVFQVPDTYWHRHHGGDHIIVMPAPVTNLRHETSKRGFFHYMSHLHAPIFLCVEYSKPFIKEYPACSVQKNIVVPYPTTDPDLFNGKLSSRKVLRSYLLYYAGGLHGDCIEIRMAMRSLMKNSTVLKDVIPRDVRPGQVEREHGFREATFCPVPVGDSPTSKRMYDILNFGCIPVVLSDDLVWAFTESTNGPLKHLDFAIHLPQSVIQFTSERTLRHYKDNKAAFGILPVSKKLLYDILLESHRDGGDYENGYYVNPLVQILRRVPIEDIEFLRKNGVNAGGHYRYYAMNSTVREIFTATHAFPDGGAIDEIVNALSDRKTYGLQKLHEECEHERTKVKHKYIGRYACDLDKKELLTRR